MARKSPGISLGQIQELAHDIVEATDSPALRVRLLRDVLGVPFDDPRVRDATAALGESRWVKMLAADQHDDGGWGAFHTATYPIRQRIQTSEVAVDRAIALGLPNSHPILARAADYTRGVLDGRIAFRHDNPAHPANRISGSTIPGSKLGAIAPDDPRLVPIRKLWAKVFARAFRGGTHDAEAEKLAHYKLVGLPHGCPTWLMFGPYHDGHHLGKYRTTLIASRPAEPGARPNELNPDMERILLRTVCEVAYGFSYFHVPLTKPPKPHPSKANAWLGSWELLTGFRFWREFAAEAMAWLVSRRGKDGFWDFGPRPSQALFVPCLVPLSESWRPKMARKHDWTARVLLLLNAYLGRERVPLTHAFDEARARRWANATGRLVRKVLLRVDCSLCVSWPKTHWARVAEPGGTCVVLVDGAKRRVRVATERCNCRGTGWHEHRFLALPRSAGVKANQRVEIRLP